MPSSKSPQIERMRAKFEPNSQDSYFEVRERYDVVKHWNEFINYFEACKDFYYINTDNGTPKWNTLTQNSYRILIRKCVNRSFSNIIAMVLFLRLS